MKSRLAEHSFGRVLLHLACVLRDHHWRWHWLGIQRELTKGFSLVRQACLVAAFLALVLLADHAHGAAPGLLVNVGHLREDSEWKAVFEKFHAALRPGGWVWIHDLIEHSHPNVQALMWERYGAYLTQLKDAAYRDRAFAYVEQDDTPRSLMFQLDLLRSVGFKEVEVLHKNNCFAAFGAMKGTGE